MASSPDGYDSDIVPLEFTLAELDMLYFTCLHDIGHPEAEEWQLTDSGFDALLKALKKIHEYHESLVIDGEPDIIEAQ